MRRSRSGHPTPHPAPNIFSNASSAVRPRLTGASESHCRRLSTEKDPSSLPRCFFSPRLPRRPHKLQDCPAPLVSHLPPDPCLLERSCRFRAGRYGGNDRGVLHCTSGHTESRTKERYTNDDRRKPLRAEADETKRNCYAGTLVRWTG